MLWWTRVRFFFVAMVAFIKHLFWESEEVESCDWVTWNGEQEQPILEYKLQGTGGGNN